MDALSHNVATALSGGGLTLPDTCGNGTVEADEVCDFGTLGGQTCAGATANAAPYGKLACGAGCVFDTSACLPCPGAAVLGACWVQASKGASCTSACTNSGLGYDPATATLAGSGASAADCLTLASAIYPFWTSPPYPSPLTVQNIGSSGVGCGVFNLPTILHDTNPTTGDATDAQVARFCACH